jgi:hypothetical protein
MWSFANNPEPRFRDRRSRMLATTWQRPGAKGFAVSAAEPPPAARSSLITAMHDSEQHRPSLRPRLANAPQL